MKSFQWLRWDMAWQRLCCASIASPFGCRKHGILHALDWLLRRWRSQSVAYGISNSEASESFCLLQEKNPFLLLCAHKDAHEYLWRFNLFVLQFYPLYVGSCEGMTQGVIRDRIMGHHNTPPWSVTAGTSQPMKILGSEGGLYSDTSIFKIKISYLHVHLERKYKRQRVTDSAVTGIALGAYQDWGEQLSRFTMMDKEACSIISLHVSVNPVTRTEGGHKCSQRESWTQLKVRMAQNKSLTLKWRVD